MPEPNDPLSRTTGATTGTRAGGSTTGGAFDERSARGGDTSSMPFGTTSASDREDAGVADKARELKDRVTAKASEQAHTAFDQQKTRAVGSLGGVVDALRQTADALSGHRETASGARFIETAADRIDGLSRTLETKNLDDLLYDVQSYARRNPAVFIGGAMALGFIAARFLKASNERSSYSRFGGMRDYGYEDALYRNPSYGTGYGGGSSSGYDSSYGSGSAGSMGGGYGAGSTGGTDFSTGGGVSGSSPGTGTSSVGGSGLGTDLGSASGSTGRGNRGGGFGEGV